MTEKTERTEKEKNSIIHSTTNNSGTVEVPENPMYNETTNKN